MFLPEVSVLVDANDVVEVTTKFGRKLTAIVARPREIECLSLVASYEVGVKTSNGVMAKSWVGHNNKVFQKAIAEASDPEIEESLNLDV